MSDDTPDGPGWYEIDKERGTIRNLEDDPRTSDAWTRDVAKADGLEMAANFLHLLAESHERLHGTTSVNAALRYAANIIYGNSHALYVGLAEQEMEDVASRLSTGLPAR